MATADGSNDQDQRNWTETLEALSKGLLLGASELQDADHRDLLQDAVVVVLKYERVHGRVRNLIAFGAIVTRGLLKDFNNKKRRSKLRLSDFTEEPAKVASDAVAMAHMELMDCMDSLEGCLRELAMLRLSGATIRHAASIQGRTYAAVQKEYEELTRTVLRCYGLAPRPISALEARKQALPENPSMGRSAPP